MNFLLSHSNTNFEILMQLHKRLNSYQNPPQRKFLITIESPEIHMNTVINDEAGIFRLQKNKKTLLCYLLKINIISPCFDTAVQHLPII